MPLRRYFLFIGGALLAFLLLIDWYLPQTAIEAAQADVDRSTIRIHSAHKWPSAVVFDTTQPTIVPPPLVQAQAAVDKPARARDTAPRGPCARQRERGCPCCSGNAPCPAQACKAPRQSCAGAGGARVANYEPFGFRPFFQTGW